MSSRLRWRSWGQLAADLNRLNYILIPTTQEERDRWQDSRTARVIRWLIFVLGRFTDDGQVLLAFTLVAGAVAMDVKRSDAYMAWATLAGLLFASWAYSPLLGLVGVKVEVVLPRRVTAGDETTFTISLRNDGTRDHDTVLVRGPFLPWDGSWLVRRTEVARLPRHSVTRAELRARFHSRGDHRLGPFRLQALVPFGFALGPALESDAVRFLAVPRVANVVSLSLPQGRRHQPGGVPRASHTADSRELLGVRMYRFGDPIRDLHARSWARLGEPVVREYREEYFSRVGIVLDTEVVHDQDENFEAAISLVGGIVDCLARTEALIDVTVAGSPASLTVGRGLGSLDRALELLARVKPGGPLDATALGGQIGPRLSSTSCVLFVALRWDDVRQAFAESVRSKGRPCAAFLVSEVGREAAAATHISPEQIRGGHELAL